MSWAAEKVTGCNSKLELSFRFYDWAKQLKTPITWQLIKTRFQVSRATAYRYLAAYKAHSQGHQS